MINVYDFLRLKKISFASNKKALNWIRKLHLQTLIRIGDSYFADEVELNESLEIYVVKQIAQRKKLRRKQAAQARKNFRKQSS